MSKIRKNIHNSEDGSSSSGSSSSLSSDEEVDARDLKPIKEYLSDRRELARQLFKSVKAEKIQMMLPQVLKKMDLGQLEKWCANELSGMSKSRILSILNGKPMLESSDTSESDDSGPSLEIISDTEEWFTDEDMSKKEEGLKALKGKIKKEKVKQKGKSQLGKKNDNKSVQKKVCDGTSNIVEVKKEEDIDKNKEKEGDSLLDLLELEMRARAIRALIRKEEDIIPNASKSAKDNDTSNKTAPAKTEQEELKEKEKCRRQLERIITAQQSSAAEDEDVVLVVQPTPTIELLSSDSEGESHSGVRVNKKFENERIMDSTDNINPTENTILNKHNINSSKISNEDKADKNTTETKNKEENTTDKTEALKRTHSNNVPQKDNHLKPSSKKRKTKKKPHTKEESKTTNSEAEQNIKNIKIDSSQNVKSSETESESVKSKTASDYSSLTKNSTEVSDTLEKTILDEEKSIDLDEIIDLDDYCDDMDDIENNENNKSKDVTENKQCKKETEMSCFQKTNGTETWASRYYQTDDVQNVIKESKIQSEIRKRLRERQRLSKLNTSPRNAPSSPPVVEANNKIVETNPMGSVDEYLALKQTVVTNLNISNSSNGSSVMKNNAADANTHTDANRLIESDLASGRCAKNQKIDEEVNLSDNANADNLDSMKSESVVNAVNVTSPS